MRVAEWGNSLAVRLPHAVVAALKIKAGDDIEIHVVDAKKLEVKKSPSAKKLLKDLEKYRGILPKDFKFDRLEANARG